MLPHTGGIPVPFVTPSTTGSDWFNPFGVEIAPPTFDGPNVDPGDVIVADNDGVVVVPRLKASEVAQSAQARIEKEEHSRKRYLAGELGLDVNNMRPKLKERGLTYVSQADWESGQ